ncbi:MAG: hypothetical protein KUL82_12970 [Bdellovibrio sp.]|nr:hypothetical protein [Bdellovibrio sp.]
MNFKIKKSVLAMGISLIANPSWSQVSNHVYDQSATDKKIASKYSGEKTGKVSVPVGSFVTFGSSPKPGENNGGGKGPQENNNNGGNKGDHGGSSNNGGGTGHGGSSNNGNNGNGGPKGDNNGGGKDDHGGGKDDHGGGKDDHGGGKDDHGDGKDDHDDHDDHDDNDDHDDHDDHDGECRRTDKHCQDDGDTPDDDFEEEEKKELKRKLKPVFYLSFDYGSYIVNLTPQFRDVQPKSSLVKYDYKPMASSDSLVYGDFRDGFQKTVYGNIEVGLGAEVQFWYDNAKGLADHFWAYVGVLPIVGKDTESTRYVSTLDKAYAMGGRWEVPKSASDLDRWDAGDSITYLGQGGVIFSAGAGFGPVGAGVAKFAGGTWETYVEKVGADKAYVKMSRGKLNSFSVFTDISIINLSLSEFRFADDGFSFVFDLTTEVGRKAYEDMIRGNVLASENFASAKPANLVERAPVIKVETFRSVSTGRIASKSLSIPIIWDKTYSKGRINSYTTSDMHVDRNTARAYYGIFSESEDSRFWTRHKEKEFMFYGAKYSVENWDSKARMDSMFGTYSYTFKHEKSNGYRLRAGIKELVKKTGLDTLMVGIPEKDLGYTGIEFNVNFDDQNTMRLMAAAQKMTQDQFIDMSTDQVYPYFKEMNDPYDYCMVADDGGSCASMVGRRTANAASKMYFALKDMYKNMNTDPKAFAVAYGQFGEGMAENLFTFRTAMKLAGPGVSVDYLIEGTYISMYFREWTVNGQGLWSPSLERPMYKGLPFNPATRHSRVRGMIIGNSGANKVPHMKNVAF